VADLEGDVGGNLDQSSRVQAVVDMFGLSSLEDYAVENLKFGRNKTPELLRAASPVEYLTPDDPPVLIFHGDQDPVVPVGQSHILHRRYQALGLNSQLYVIEGAGHGGNAFSDDIRFALIKDFLDDQLAGVGTGKRLTGLHWMVGPRAGLEGSQQQFEQLLDRIDANLSENPNITGVYVITHWDLIDPRAGQFDITRLDKV
jgi:acetyl esterase/lipase